MKKVIVITGATDGIGKELTKLLNKDYLLAICGRSEEKMNKLLNELEYPVYHECFDITDETKRKSFCFNVLNHYKHIDVVINNAGANTQKDQVVNININDLRYMFELNTVAPLDIIQQFYPTMKQQQSGLFVNILSTCCLYNNPNNGSYSASKDAFEGLSKTLLKEVRVDHIGVCNVYPGGVDTSFRPNESPDYLRPITVAKMIKSCIENEDGVVHDIVIRPFIESNFA